MTEPAENQNPEPSRSNVTPSNPTQSKNGTANLRPFNPETGRAAAALSVVSRRAKRAAILQTQAIASQPHVDETDPFVSELARAQALTLDRFIKAQDPRDKAQLARALRDLRETWHMVTGTPKPGMTKPGAMPVRASRLPSAQPTPSAAADLPALPAESSQA